MFKNKRIEELEKRVEELEKIVAITIKTEKTAALYFGIDVGQLGVKTVPINKVLSAVLDHLKMKLTLTDATPERVTLVKKQCGN